MKNTSLTTNATRDRGLYSIQNLFQDFFGDGSNSLWSRGDTEFIPRLNVSENDSGYKVVAELPGLDEKDFEVTIEDNLLRIKGERKAETENNDDHYHRYESSYGSFERVLRMPEAINSDACKVNFKNGLLTVEIPKDKETSKVKKLKINS